VVPQNAVAPIHLRRTEENADEIEALARRHRGRVGIDGVLAHLDRQATRARVPGRKVTWGFRWDDADDRDVRWWPQGISTSADANDDEDVAGRRIVVTSWYAKDVGDDQHGSRVTFVDLDTLRYRHVLLVTPELHHGRPRLRPLVVHAGGIVWCGHQLHVAGTRRGLFTCLVDDIVEVEPSPETFGHRFVLPVRSAYVSAGAEGAEPMRYSFLSLDRGTTPFELVAGEYGVKGQSTRLVRYPLDPQTLHLSTGKDRLSRPAALDEQGIGHMQGAAVVRGRYYVTHSRGRWRLGHLHVGTPGRWRRFARALPVGPEDISYWPSTDQLWSLTEYPGRRFVFAMDRSQFG
jgi:hypothetical protein